MDSTQCGGSTSSHPTAAGDIINLDPNWNRVYSYRAIWRPLDHVGML